jgi:hypothetical protein
MAAEAAVPVEAAAEVRPMFVWAVLMFRTGSLLLQVAAVADIPMAPVPADRVVAVPVVQIIVVVREVLAQTTRDHRLEGPAVV